MTRELGDPMHDGGKLTLYWFVVRLEETTTPEVWSQAFVSAPPEPTVETTPLYVPGVLTELSASAT